MSEFCPHLWVLLHCIHTLYLVSLFLRGWAFGCFPPSAVVNGSAVDIHKQVLCGPCPHCISEVSVLESVSELRLRPRFHSQKELLASEKVWFGPEEIALLVTPAVWRASWWVWRPLAWIHSQAFEKDTYSHLAPSEEGILHWLLRRRSWGSGSMCVLVIRRASSISTTLGWR